MREKALLSLSGAERKWSEIMNVIEERKVSDSMVETVHMVRPNHMNAAGRLFGGMLMQWLDEVAGLVTKRHTRSNVIAASLMWEIHPWSCGWTLMWNIWRTGCAMR